MSAQAPNYELCAPPGWPTPPGDAVYQPSLSE